MKEKRINYFDIIKTISIFFVVYLHYPWISGSIGSNTSMLICYTSVPLFFMVNGALLLNKPFDMKKHILKIKRILINMFFWKLLILTICLITKFVFLKDYRPMDLFFYLFVEWYIKDVPAEHIWFMYTLIKIYIMYPMIQFLFQNKKVYLKYILIFCLIFGFGIELINDIILVLNKIFDIGIVSFDGFINSYSPFGYLCPFISYFVLGYYIHKKYYNNKISRLNIFLLCILFFIGLCLLFVTRWVQTGNILYGDYQVLNNVYSKLGTFIMSCSSFILISRIKIKNSKVFNYIGSNTIGIYYVHMIIASYLSRYFLGYFVGYYGMKLNFLRTIFVFFVSIVFVELFKKIPFVKRIVE